MSRRVLDLFVLGILAAVWPGPAVAEEPAAQPRPGFRIERMAAEPLIESPIAFDWGADGKLWVVEMRDYPLGMDNKGKPGGRIVVLEDTHGNGRYDKATVFLDGLLFPTSVMTWGKGVLVTCAPDIFYAEDTDGDGKADRRAVLFTGFGEANPQHRVNGLRWGLDNWIYCANGDFTAERRFEPAAGPDKPGTGFSASQAEDLRRLMLAGASIKSIKTGAMASIRNRDFRFRPSEGLLDPQTGQAQYGRDRDDWGHWFGCNNAVPMWHVVLDDHYLRRNPHPVYPSPRVEAPPSVTHPLGNVGRDTGTKRTARGNPWTSACSITIYRDELFGAEFRNNWLTCEPVHNLVHREILTQSGTTFKSRRAADEMTSEFLASADTMFSPVFVRTGPDGALWVADMYRKVLEHPHWLPQGWEKTIDVRAGQDKGRIYRVYPAGKKPRPIPRLDRLDAAGLVALLDSPNGWQRDKAQEMLIRRGDRAAVPLLEEHAAHSPRPLGRLHALCTLDGLQALEPATLLPALGDAHPGVRRHAVRLTEHHASAEVTTALLSLAADPDAMLRQQVAYSLGFREGAAAARALGRLLLQDAGDPYIVAAGLSSLTPANLSVVLETVLASPADPPLPLQENLLRTALGFGDARAMVTLLNRLVRPQEGRYTAAQFAALGGWLDALEQRNTSLTQLARPADAALQAGVKRLQPVFEAARKALRDPQGTVAERLQAMRLLGRGLDRQQEDRDLLAEALAPQTAEPLQAAAIAALGQLRDPQAIVVLLQNWKSYTPALRAEALDALLRRADGPRAVLAGLDRKQLLPQDVPLTARQRLLGHPSKEVRGHAAKVFTDRVDPDRNKVVLAYEAALKLTGKAARGQQLFEKNCAVCHRKGPTGQSVGPDLATVRDKPPDWFLTAIFDPSRAVEPRYLNYVAMTKDGKVLTGVLGEESGDRLTLLSPNGQAQVVLRSNLEELASTGKSAMPEGLEKDLKPQDVADVIAFLRSPAPPAK
jgi:putative membrane-bound dehydrogenase-like protein